jgi:PEP-CTERM motif
MKNALFLLTFGLCSSIAATPASASTIVFDGGGPDLGGTYYSDANNGLITASAEQFVLSAGASTLGGAAWWGGCSPGPDCPAASFVIGFFEDASGQPGSPIQIYSVGDASQTATGNLIGVVPGQSDGFTEYQYTATFADLALSPGVSYWFAIQNSTPDGTWGWETTGAGGGDGHAYLIPPLWGGPPFDGPPFNGYLPADLAFNLTAPDETAPVPEPATLSLVGLGLLAGARRIRRAKR